MIVVCCVWPLELSRLSGFPTCSSLLAKNLFISFGLPSVSAFPWLSLVSYFSFIDVQLKNDTWTLPAGIDDLSFMMMTMTMMMTYAPATGLPPPPARGALSENFFTLICRIAENAFMIPASRYVFAYLFNFLRTKMPSQILIKKWDELRRVKSILWKLHCYLRISAGVIWR